MKASTWAMMALFVAVLVVICALAVVEQAHAANMGGSGRPAASETCGAVVGAYALLDGQAADVVCSDGTTWRVTLAPQQPLPAAGPASIARSERGRVLVVGGEAYLIWEGQR